MNLTHFPKTKEDFQVWKIPNCEILVLPQLTPVIQNDWVVSVLHKVSTENGKNVYI